MTVRQIFLLLAVLVPALIVGLVQVWQPFIWLFVIVAPFLIVGFVDFFQTKHSIRRLYPVIGHFRYIFESVRKEIQQYFVETNLPVNHTRCYHGSIWFRS